MNTKSIYWAANALGVNAMSRLNNIENVACLMYHGVANDNNTVIGENWLHVKASEFMKQMQFLQTRFDVMPFHTVAKMLSIGYTPSKMEKPIAAITFDDGYANNYSVAFPILKALGLPATIFLVTDTIGKDHVFWYDKLLSLHKKMPLSEIDKLLDFVKETVHPSLMDSEIDEYLQKAHQIDKLDSSVVEAFRTMNHAEIIDMVKSKLITFGSHTHKHELLTSLSPDDMVDTLTRSRDVLGSLLGGPPESICYPNGYYTNNIIDLAQGVGYKFGITADSGFWTTETNPFKIPRLAVGRDTTFNEFKAMLCGTTSRLVNLKRSIKSCLKI